MALRSGRRAATQPLQKFPRSYLGAGRGRERLGGSGRGGADRSGAGRGKTGRGGARPTARPEDGGSRAPASLRVRSAGLRGLLGHRGAGTGRERRERRTRSARVGSWQPSPAARSPPLYTGRSGITTAEGLQAQARWLASQQPSPLTGSGRSSPASLLLPAAHWPTAGRAFPFRIFATSPSFLELRGGPWLRCPSLLRHRPALSPVQLVSGRQSRTRSSSSAQNPPPLPALRGASLKSFSQRSSAALQTQPTNTHIQGQLGTTEGFTVCLIFEYCPWKVWKPLRLVRFGLIEPYKVRESTWSQDVKRICLLQDSPGDPSWSKA